MPSRQQFYELLDPTGFEENALTLDNGSIPPFGRADNTFDFRDCSLSLLNAPLSFIRALVRNPWVISNDSQNRLFATSHGKYSPNSLISLILNSVTSAVTILPKAYEPNFEKFSPGDVAGFLLHPPTTSYSRYARNSVAR